ncbi:MAG: hypothetical protein V8R80_02995 [Eubacterium sp.]
MKKTKKQTLFYIEVWRCGKDCEKRYKNGGKIMRKTQPVVENACYVRKNANI